MAKKVRRVRRPRPRKTNNAAVVPDAPPPRMPPKQTTEEEMRQEYAYVVKDLRRVFILAVAMFALLILLNILLR